MSKSPNIFLPALGVTGIVLGGAVAFSTQNYRVDEAETALRAAAAAEARAEAVAAEKTQLEAEVAELAARPVSTGSVSAPAPAAEGVYGLGRAAHADEIAAWDIDVLPDGRGLPEGSGDVLTGDEVFADRCASCHGDFAEGVDNWPVLAGGFDTLADEDPVKTVGSYWPYLSTVFDYVNRSMPFGEAQSLTADETYAIVAYILYSNDMVDEDFVLSPATFLDVEMYNDEGFIIDDRTALEYAPWSTEPCMENCKDTVEITKRASAVNVTPLDEFMHPAMRGEMHDASMGTETEQPTQTASTETVEVASEPGVDPAVLAAGEKVFAKCKSCHQVGDNAKNRSGPHLNNVIGRVSGTVDDFRYSGAMKDAAITWNAETLAAFLTAPKTYIKGTKMSFRGLKKDEDIQALTAYLASLSQ